MNHSYPNNCKECYKRIMGTCLLWRQVRILGYNKHPNCPESDFEKEILQSESKKCGDKISNKSLCDSCINDSCIFQSGIFRNHCDFYKSESEE